MKRGEVLNSLLLFLLTRAVLYATIKKIMHCEIEFKGVGTISRVRIEPTLELKKKKSIGFGIRVKYIGEIYFEGDAYDFFESLKKR